MGRITDKPTLDYGHPPPIGRRMGKWAFRLFLAAWAAGTCYLAYDKWGVFIPKQAELLRQQQKCGEFSLPPGTIVFEDEEGTAKSLLERPGYVEMQMGLDVLPINPFRPVRAKNGMADAAIAQYVKAQAEVDELQTDRYPRLPTGSLLPHYEEPDGRTDSTTVFLHRRTAPDGEARLVSVSADWFMSKGLYAKLKTTSRPLENWLGTSRSVGKIEETHDFALTSRIYAGQPDPNDPTRFTIDYISENRPGRVEGRLLVGGGIELKQVAPTTAP